MNTKDLENVMSNAVVYKLEEFLKLGFLLGKCGEFVDFFSRGLSVVDLIRFV